VPTRRRSWLLISAAVTALALARFLIGGQRVPGSIAASLVFGALTYAFFMLRAALLDRRERRRSSSAPPE
jgi:hypothetical protein